MAKKTQEERDEFLAALPPPPAGVQLDGLEDIPEPGGHPYVIGPSLVAFAADKCGGILNDATIERAERAGVRCCMQGCTLPYSAHKSILVLFVSLPPGTPKLQNLKDVPGLHEYLLSIQERCDAFGIEGFGFPIRKAVSTETPPAEIPPG